MGNSLSYCDDAPTKEVEAAPAVETQEDDTPVEEEPEQPVPRKFPKKPKFWTAPNDPRFRSTNQARACYTRYNEYYKCKAEKDEDSEECIFYKRCCEIICPQEWLERWEEMRAEGIWAGRY